MILGKIREILEAEVIAGSENLGMEVKVGCASDLMSDVLSFAKPGSILLTGLTNPQVVRTAEMADIKAICFVRDKRPNEKAIELAESNNLLMLTTHLSMFESCGRLYEQGLASLGYLNIGKKNG